MAQVLGPQCSVHAALPGCCRSTAAATEQAIRTWHGQMMRSAVLDDDVTVVVIRVVGADRPLVADLPGGGS